MKPVFIQLQCLPGKTYEVADALYELEIASELYSTSGEYDLLMKLYIDPEQDEDIGRLINDRISAIPGIVRTLTTLTFKAFCAGSSSGHMKTPAAAAGVDFVWRPAVGRPPWSRSVRRPSSA